MNESAKTKKALRGSLFALFLCIVLLIGTTFAWFTDSVSTGVNKIQAGNLKVGLQYKNAADGEFTNVTEATKVFKENVLWEPGHVEYAVLKVKNEGNLALKYKLGINIDSEKGSTNVNGDAFKLSDYINFAVVDGDKSNLDRTALVAAAGEGQSINKGYSKESHLDTTGANETVTLVVWMPETVGNEANHTTDANAPEINLGVNVVATQKDYESDSFNNEYDKNATYPVSDNEGLAEALEKIETGGTMVIASGEYTVPSSNVAEDVTFAGAGRTKTVLKPENKNFTTKNATFKDMKIDGRNTSSFDGNGVIKLEGNNAVLDNVEVVGGGTNTYGHSVRTGESTTIKNSYIHGAFRAIQAYDVKGTLLIEDSTLAPQCYPINVDGGTGKLVVKNSTLKGWTSYTSSLESAAFTGCKFEKNTEGGSYGYNCVRAYTDTIFVNCDFGDEFWFGAANKVVNVTFDNCTYKGMPITKSNVNNVLEPDDNANTIVVIK